MRFIWPQLKCWTTREGRKALIVIGDGDDAGSVVSEARAIRAAQKADVLIYCIRIVDKDLSSSGTQMKKGLSLPGVGSRWAGVDRAVREDLGAAVREDLAAGARAALEVRRRPRVNLGAGRVRTGQTARKTCRT